MPPVGARPPGHPRDVALRDNSQPSHSFLDAAARTAEHGNGTFRRAAKERSWSAQSPRRRSAPDPSSGFWKDPCLFCWRTDRVCHCSPAPTKRLISMDGAILRGLVFDLCIKFGAQ